MAQLVEHHLAKVRVAGSNPVVRSERVTQACPGGVAERLRQRPAKPCTRVRIPYPPLRSTVRAIGAVVARFLDTEEVTGSNPVSPTSMKQPLTCGNAEIRSCCLGGRVQYVSNGSGVASGLAMPNPHWPLAS